MGYERITGLRLPGQMLDGSFTVSRTRALAQDGDTGRALLLEEGARADLFPDFDLVLRSNRRRRHCDSPSPAPASRWVDPILAPRRAAAAGRDPRQGRVV